MFNQFLISRILPTVILVFDFKYIILELRVKAKRKTLVVKSDSSDADFIVPDDEIESSESESEDLRESPKFSLADRIKVSHCWFFHQIWFYPFLKLANFMSNLYICTFWNNIFLQDNYW